MCRRGPGNRTDPDADHPCVKRRNLLLVVLLAAVAALAACGGDDASAPTTTEDDGAFSGYTREPTPSVAEVELPIAAGGEVLPAVADDGGLRIVYFGYTSCPDVCPTTMSDVKQALAELPADERERVDVAMVTVDPDRDVPEKLGAYVTTFVPEGDAVRFVDDAGLAEAAAAFGAQYEVETNDEGEIEVGHSADLYVVDDHGDVVLQWPFGTSSEDIAADLSTLLT